MKTCVTGATGFVGGHVARLLAERGDEVRITYRDRSRLERLDGIGVQPVSADVLNTAAMRRAVRGSEVLFHTAGYVGSQPVERVWEVNALGPRIAVEAAAAEKVGRVVVTSSVAGLGPSFDGKPADERNVYRAGGIGLSYVDAKHEGEAEALAAGARLGIDVVVVNPSYVLGVPVDRSAVGETSTRTVGNYLAGRLPAVVDGWTNISDVRDVAAGHLLAADRGKAGQRYALGGNDIRWVDVIDRIAELSGVHHPLLVLPPEVGPLARTREALRLPGPVSAEAYLLMGQDWRCSSAKAKRELGYRRRSIEKTLRDTVDWYLERIAAGTFGDRGTSSLSLASTGMRIGERLGLVRGLKIAERYVGRRLVAGA